MATKTYQRVVSIGYVVCAAVVYLFMGQVTELIWDLARLPYPEGWALNPPELVGLLSAGLVFFAMRYNSRINDFMNESAGELAKVTWPEQKETVMSTGVIVLMVGFSAICLTLFDVVWGWCVRLIY